MDEPLVLFLSITATFLFAGAAFVGIQYAIRRWEAIDFEDWRGLAARRGWSFSATGNTCKLIARLHESTVTASAVGTYSGRLPSFVELFGTDDDPEIAALIVATSIMAPISGAPRGFSVQERLPDGTDGAPDRAVVLDDAALDAVIVATGDEDAVRALLDKHHVREGILGLVPLGRLSIALDVVLLHTTGDLVAATELEVLVDRVAALAAAIGVPAPGERATPVPSGPGIRRPRLGALVQRVATAATRGRGRAAAEELTGRGIICQFQLHGAQLLGPADTSLEVILVGVDVHGATRVELKARVSHEEIRRMLPGMLITAESIVARYDHTADAAELHADGPLALQEDPEPSARHRREAAFAALADQVGLKPDLTGLIEVLCAASATRARLLVHIAGREYHGEFVPIRQRSPRDGAPPGPGSGNSIIGRVGKREVELVFPRSAQQPSGRVRVTVLRWDELASRPVLRIAEDASMRARSLPPA